MREHPILFSSSMVRAILAGTKTQTRRVIKVQPPSDQFEIATCLSTTGDKRNEGKHHWIRRDGVKVIDDDDRYFPSPYGYAGDQLWVRETHAPIRGQDGSVIAVDYRATYEHGSRLGDYLGVRKDWKPAIHMRREYARLLLQITNMRVQRLQEITEADATAEGVHDTEFYETAEHKVNGGAPWSAERLAFADLWNSINGPGAWDANPYVWVVCFRRLHP